MCTRPDYAAEVAYRRSVLDALLLPEPPAPVCPHPLWQLDSKGELQETAAYVQWQSDIKVWGQNRSVRFNGEVRAAVEADIFAWTCTGVQPDPATTIATLRARLDGETP